MWQKMKKYYSGNSTIVRRVKIFAKVPILRMESEKIWLINDFFVGEAKIFDTSYLNFAEKQKYLSHDENFAEKVKILI